MNSRELSKAFYNRFAPKYEIIAPNIYLDYAHCEMDILCIRKSGYMDEIEIKISPSDFKADFKKTMLVKESKYKHTTVLKHDMLKEGKVACNRFSFLILDTMLTKCEIPDYSGLYVYNTQYGTISCSKEPPLLHKRKVTDKQKYDICKKMMYRYWKVV